MLNLSDIRKKANTQGKKNKLSGRAMIEEPIPPDANEEKISSEAAPKTNEGSPSESPPPEDIVVQPSGMQPTSGDPYSEGTEDPLESLFSANPELGLATEEAYFEGLVGRERETEETLCQLLSFALGEEEYAVDIQDVQEIIKLREMTDVPRVPEFVLGIISLRGNIIPVFDLKRRLHLGSVEPATSTRIVVCHAGGKSVGLVVDKINQVVRLPEQAIEQVSGLLSGVNKDLVEGVGRYEGRMLILLDLPSVLAVEKS